ncbi:cytochrome P460 family protein [Robertmurraya sp.]|uniref:cytochrome P460 family protein n=1 Tax=Robertmurraya sp. TaxID=2837525 RepID=UPI0037042837
MKLRLILLLTLFLIFTLTACNNNDDNTMVFESQREQEEGTESDQGQEFAEIGSGANLVKFPEDLEEGIIFATYDRGDIHEDIYVNTQEAIEAVQNGEEFPSGTVITLVGYKDGELEHYLVMEKRTGWGSQYSPEERNGEWEYQHFTPDREVAEDNIGRCFSCHANQERDEYINSLDQMKEFDLEELAQSKNSSTETSFAAIPTKDWKVTEISSHLIESKDVSKEKNSLIEDQNKTEKINEILLKMYLEQFKS